MTQSVSITSLCDCVMVNISAVMVSFVGLTYKKQSVILFVYWKTTPNLMFVTVTWTVKRWVFPNNAISFHPQYYLEMNAPTSKKIIFVGFPNYQNYLLVVLIQRTHSKTCFHLSKKTPTFSCLITKASKGKGLRSNLQPAWPMAYDSPLRSAMFNSPNYISS